MPSEVLLLSIRPEFASKIFNGTKTVELRRIRPRLKAEDQVLVYVSTPIQALIGMFQVEKVITASPGCLWGLVRNHAGITREQFDLYFSGTERAYGIFLKAARHLPAPIGLWYLRQILAGFQPPQSYRYLSSDQASLIDLESHKFRKRALLQQMPSARPSINRNSTALL